MSFLRTSVKRLGVAVIVKGDAGTMRLVLKALAVCCKGYDQDIVRLGDRINSYFLAGLCCKFILQIAIETTSFTHDVSFDC